ncbi:MAG: hypothetical protein AAB405_01235 [Patescibacteria group bacterium]
MNKSFKAKNLKIKSAQDLQDKGFSKMSADKKIRLTFSLNRLVRRIAEDSIKEQYPQADDKFIKEKLRERARQ